MTLTLPSVAVARADVERLTLEVPDPASVFTPLVKFQNLSPGRGETDVPAGTPIRFTMHTWLDEGQRAGVWVNDSLVLRIHPSTTELVDTDWQFAISSVSLVAPDWVLTPVGQTALDQYQSEATIRVRITLDGYDPVEWSFTVSDSTPISVLGAVAPGLKRVVVEFDDDVLVPDGAAFTVTGVDAPAAGVTVVSATPSGKTVVLELDRETSFGVRYQVACTGVTDELGNGLAVSSTVFTSYQPTAPAARRFKVWDNLLPMQAKLEDTTGDLRRFALCLQDVLDLLLLRIDEWPTIFDPTRAPEVWLDQILADLGSPFVFPMTVPEKRRLASVLVPLYQLRGTEPGLIQAVRFLMDLEVTIVAAGDRGGELGVAQLGVDFILGTSDRWKIFAFSVVSPVVLTEAQRARLRAIVAFMKPANLHLASIIEPFAPPVSPNHWAIGQSQLGTQSILHGENEPHEGRVYLFGGGTATSPTSAGGARARMGGSGAGSAPSPTGSGVAASFVPSPEGYGSDLKFWLRSDLGVSKTGQSVNSWTEQVNGTRYDASANKPNVISGAINGREVINFPSAAYVLSAAANLAASIPPPWTVVAVLVTSVPVNGAQIIIAGYRSLRIAHPGNANDWKIEGCAGVDSAVISAGAVGGAMVLRISSGSRADAASINGEVSDITGTALDIDWASAVGAVGYPLSGTIAIAELFVVARDSNLSEVASYIQARYGLTLE